VDVAIAIAIAVTIAIAISVAVAVNLTVAYHCCRRCLHRPLLFICHCPSLLPSLLHCRHPSTAAIADSVTVGNHSRHLHWPSLLLLPLPIAESCCLGMARIVFKQFKQIMLTSFYFIPSGGSTLIKAG
jgi:hypothetical protein